MDRFGSRMTPRFLAELEKGMLWESRVIKSGKEIVKGFKEDEKGKRRASVLSSLSLSWFLIVHMFMSSVYIVFCGEAGHFAERSGFLERVSSMKSRWFTERLAVISERTVVYRTKRTGPSTEPWGIPYMSLDGDEDELLTKVDWYVWEMWLKALV